MRRAHYFHEHTGAGVYVLICHEGQNYVYSSGVKPPLLHLDPAQFGPKPTRPSKRQDFPPPHKDIVSASISSREAQRLIKITTGPAVGSLPQR